MMSTLQPQNICLCLFIFTLCFVIENNITFLKNSKRVLKFYRAMGINNALLNDNFRASFASPTYADYVFHNGIQKQSVDTILQQVINFDNIINRIEPIETVQFTMFHSKQLMDAWGKDSINSFHNKEHACPFVQKCLSVVGDLTPHSSLSKSRASVNMISNCQSIENDLSKSYSVDHALYAVGQKVRKVLLCGEGGRAALEGKLEEFDIAFLFNPIPYDKEPVHRITKKKTDLLFFNPHVRGGVKFFLNQRQRLINGNDLPAPARCCNICQ